MKTRLNQQGFSALEVALVVIAMGLVGGTGTYVYKANQKTSQTLSSAHQDASTQPTKVVAKQATAASSTATPSATKYLTIKEWGVRASYTDDDTYSYTTSMVQGELFIQVMSSKLTAANCSNYGGSIGRYTANQAADDGGDSAATLAKSAPDVVKHVGNYYYVYTHPQDACSEDDDTTNALVTTTDQNILSLMQHFQAD